jgi:hypothetical protein
MPEFRKKAVTITAHQWFKNGDHPDDGPADCEGTVVRYFRRPEPEYAGENTHDLCGETWHNHGWIDTLEGGHTVCPSDWIVTGVHGERYPVKDSIFRETYEAATGEPTAAYIEIVEKNRTTDDTAGGSVIFPNEVRINGIPLLCPEGEQVKVHGMTFDDGHGEDVAQVTLTLFARRVVIAAEGDL